MDKTALLSDFCKHTRHKSLPSSLYLEVPAKANWTAAHDKRHAACGALSSFCPGCSARLSGAAAGSLGLGCTVLLLLSVTESLLSKGLITPIISKVNLSKFLLPALTQDSNRAPCRLGGGAWHTATGCGTKLARWRLACRTHLRVLKRLPNINFCLQGLRLISSPDFVCRAMYCATYCSPMHRLLAMGSAVAGKGTGWLPLWGDTTLTWNLQTLGKN